MSNAILAEEPVVGGTGICEVDERGVYKGGEPIAGNTVTKSVLAFVEAVEATENLKIVGTEDGTDDFILEGMNVSGEHIIVKLQEIVELVVISQKSTLEENADRYVRAINGERCEIELQGVSRIVGYFSRVNNWNRSKISELRSRQKGTYGVNRLKQ